jgi:acyl-CoA synthetase (AMP-forming)/AMP-acid ligase II
VADERLGQAIVLVVRGSGDDAALRAALRRDLPNFMQPSVVRWVAQMPLNPNGKIDRAALAQSLAQKELA